MGNYIHGFGYAAVHIDKLSFSNDSCYSSGTGISYKSYVKGYILYKNNIGLSILYSNNVVVSECLFI